MLLRMILVVESEDLGKAFKKSFEQSNVRVENLGRHKNPFQRALHTSGDIFVVSHSLLPEPADSAINLLNDLPENPTTVILHSSASPEDHADLITMGADVVLYEGLQKNLLIEAVETILDSRRNLLDRPLSGERPPVKSKLENFVTQSPQMRILMQTASKMAMSSAPILILGETGVGKEHLAKTIHAESQRSAAPFVAVNCAALPEQLLESELFGHEEGAFTGAVRQRRGAFELAHGGTLLLDEIGEIPLHLQAKLLRVLQEYEFRPIGSERSVWVDVRVIAITNRDIEEEMEKGDFRKDLYYRLSVLSLTVPPLRERVDDIPALVTHFLGKLGKKMNKDILGISGEALETLMRYPWPGNIRELINVIERAIILCRSNMISLADLPQGIYAGRRSAQEQDEAGSASADYGWSGRTLPEVRKQVIENLERSYLQMALSEADGRVGDAAKIAGIHPRGLYDKMKQYGIKKEKYRGTKG